MQSARSKNTERKLPKREPKERSKNLCIDIILNEGGQLSGWEFSYQRQTDKQSLQFTNNIARKFKYLKNRNPLIAQIYNQIKITQKTRSCIINIIADLNPAAQELLLKQLTTLFVLFYVHCARGKKWDVEVPEILATFSKEFPDSAAVASDASKEELLTDDPLVLSSESVLGKRKKKDTAYSKSVEEVLVEEEKVKVPEDILSSDTPIPEELDPAAKSFIELCRKAGPIADNSSTEGETTRAEKFGYLMRTISRYGSVDENDNSTKRVKREFYQVQPTPDAQTPLCKNSLFNSESKSQPTANNLERMSPLGEEDDVDDELNIQIEDLYAQNTFGIK